MLSDNNSYSLTIKKHFPIISSNDVGSEGPKDPHFFNILGFSEFLAKVGLRGLVLLLW